jgi:hypothetical protein
MQSRRIQGNKQKLALEEIKKQKKALEESIEQQMQDMHESSSESPSTTANKQRKHNRDRNAEGGKGKKIKPIQPVAEKGSLISPSNATRDKQKSQRLGDLLESHQMDITLKATSPVSSTK